jgi:hypothetical protein
MQKAPELSLHAPGAGTCHVGPKALSRNNAMLDDLIVLISLG